jgi:hypothetical protein
VHDGVDRGDRSDDPFAQGDDHEQPVALGDVVRVPRRPALAALRDERTGQLDADQCGRDREGLADRQAQDREQHPEHLRHADRRDVRQRSGTPCWVVTRGARPEEDQRQPHDDVPGHGDAVVEHVALVDRRERLLETEGEDDHADHHDHRRDPEHPVVVVVRRCEPRVVDPCPRRAERREREPEDARPDVTLGDVVREFVGRDAERDDERQIEEELERRRAAVALVRVAPGQAPAVVRAVVRRCF